MSEDFEFSWENPEYRRTYHHTCSHIMAQAVQHLFPGTKFAIGPAIDDGFYYDLDSEHIFTPDDFELIEAEMRKICKAKIKLERFELPRDAALALVKSMDQPYKVELINDLPEDAVISFYRQDDFTDLCAGPHLDSTGRVKGNGIKITSVTGAYWRGDSSRKMLQRLYAVSFPSKDMLDEYLQRIEEAKKRDHRKLGRELGLFAFRDEAPGFPFYLPKGMVLRNTLIDYWREVHKKWDYLEISTPQIMKRTLWETSGHWDHYKDNMYTTVIDEEDFAIKPMNCPGSILVYDLEPHSYRDLPLRYGELGLVHRHELSGALHGMFRVRCFTQDDAHILLAKDQIQNEVVRIAKLLDEVYTMFGLPYTIELSTMPEDHIGSVADWDLATAALADAITSIGKTYVVNPGDGAFYGPKLDYHVEDSLGRTWQCGTIQLDYQLPGRFNLEYTDANGEKQCPVMIHRVVFGSIERFMGVITEHFAGAFPTWLAPVQVRVLPISDKYMEQAAAVKDVLDKAGLRAELDDRSEKIGYKIRDARMQRIPYMLIIGEKETESGTYSVRGRAQGDMGSMTPEAFLSMIREEIDTKAILKAEATED